MSSREGSGAAVHGSDIGRVMVDEQRNILAKSLHKIEHCLSQLTDADMSWRPRPEMNSIAIVVNHLCGNVRQWIICGLTGAPDHRDRPGEFADPGLVTVDAIRSKLRTTIAETDAVLAKLDPQDLLRVRRVQAFDVSGMHALMDCVSHFVGHMHQIVQWTRMIRGAEYKFDFVPKGKEQGGDS